MKLKATRFRVLNYCNIDDSGWIPLEPVTAFVGRNESGKTALLRALHKFNPATNDSYDSRLEFPRNRLATEFESKEEWPVCRVEFDLSDQFHEELSHRIGSDKIPHTVILTRHYSGRLTYEYGAEISDDRIDPDDLWNALDSFEKDARRISAIESEDLESLQELRTKLVKWADRKKKSTRRHQNLRTAKGVKLLQTIRRELNLYAHPLSAPLIERIQSLLDELLKQAKSAPISIQINEAISDELPVFIYFDNYGIVDSSIYLPRFLEDLKRDAGLAHVRTINAMFKHADITAKEIAELGQEEADKAVSFGEDVTSEMIQRDQAHKTLRSIKLNSASIDISDKFNKWYRQRTHKFRYQADGSYFRIWVSDDRLPGVDIELECRSKGFQWFFSFYLVFLVESNEGHKDAILLLDEPGLHLHPTAQQELIAFFEMLSENNPLIYTTHSPFLIDGEHIHRVRPITEDESGHCRTSVGSWPQDWEAIFPLCAAAGYAMVRGLFQHKMNVLVEGVTDYLYLHALNDFCRQTKRQALPEEIYITPCGGTKYVGHIASLFLGQKVRPVVLLDGDFSGKVRRDELMKRLYCGHENTVLLLSEILNLEECEIEDLIGESTILRGLESVIGTQIMLNEDDRDRSNLVAQIKNAATRLEIGLPDGWKNLVARSIVVNWSMSGTESIPSDILDRAEVLFEELNRSFGCTDATNIGNV